MNNTISKCQKLKTEWNFQELLVKHRKEDKGYNTIGNFQKKIPIQWGKNEFEMETYRIIDAIKGMSFHESTAVTTSPPTSTLDKVQPRNDWMTIIFWRYHSIDDALRKKLSIIEMNPQFWNCLLKRVCFKLSFV